MNALSTEQQATWDALISHAVPFAAQQMSEALYRYLCDYQLGEHAYGEDGRGNSMEIRWSASHEEWQIINRFADGTTDTYYDHFHEDSWKYEDPRLLWDMCGRCNLIEDLEESAQ